jgi:hypothetical protein
MSISRSFDRRQERRAGARIRNHPEGSRHAEDHPVSLVRQGGRRGPPVFYASGLPRFAGNPGRDAAERIAERPPGSVKVVDFVLFGQSFTAMSAGPLDPFNHAVSFSVNCDDQAELDKYWNALLGNGGTPSSAAGCATAMASAGRSSPRCWAR